MGLDMGPFDKAWKLLKALPEQQAFSAYAPAPKTMGPGLTGTFDTDEFTGGPARMAFERYGTVHPAIRGLLERRAGYSRRSGPNLHVDRQGSMRSNPYASGESIEYYSDMAAPDRRFIDDEQKEEDEAQERRGSMFSGNPDEYAVPGVRLTPAQINPTE